MAKGIKSQTLEKFYRAEKLIEQNKNNKEFTVTIACKRAGLSECSLYKVRKEIKNANNANKKD